MKLDELWNRIKEFQGESFQTKKGIVFHYEVSADSLTVKHLREGKIPTRYSLLALDVVPWGHNYIWAILHDERIRQGDW